MDDAVRLLTVQFLAWTERAPRTYGEAMAAWRTSCPRLPVWEDALDGGLVRVEPSPGGGAMADSAVVLTPRGRAALAAVEQAATGPGGGAPAHAPQSVARSGYQSSASTWVSKS